MKKLLPICVLFNCAFANAQSPAIQWQKSLGGSGWDFGETVYQTNDGGYIIAGISESVDGDVTGNHGGGDCWIVKMDLTGIVQWKQTLGGSLYDLANSVIQTTDGGYIIAGVSISTDGDVTGNIGSFDYWIIKLTSAGIVDWKKNLGGSGWDDGESIQQTTDGGYIITGYSNSTDIAGITNKGGFDYWVVKIDNMGNVEWSKNYGGTGDDYAVSIKQTTDNGYIVSGWSVSNDGDIAADNHGGKDSWIVKLNNTGNIEWTKSLGGPADDASYSIVQTADGGYVAAGFSGSNGGNVTGNHGNNDYWVVKLDETGILQWQKSLGGSGDDQGFPIQNCADGGFIISGYSGSNDGDASGNHGGSDMWVLRLSATGNIVWQKSLGGTGAEDARSIQQTTDGGYVIFGSSGTADGDVTSNQGNLDYWIVKLDAFSLPLKLLSFDAFKNKTNVQLSWKTTNEINTSYFMIQHSDNGNTFNDIGKVEAENTSGNNEYSFTDEKPVNGDNFYRLKMVDLDGQTTYSFIIKIAFGNTSELQVFPNPAKNIITVNGLQNKGTIKIISADGKLIKQVSITGISLQIDISKLAKGMYILQYNNEVKTEQIKIIKQ